MKLTRELLAEVGFARGYGWPHEVWYYDSPCFWVHFGAESKYVYNGVSELDGDNVTLAELVAAMMKAVDAWHDERDVYQQAGEDM